MELCIVCGNPTLCQPFSTENITISELWEKRFHSICDALRIAAESQSWSLYKEEFPLCASCGNVGDRLSAILDQIKLLEMEYEGARERLRGLIREADANSKGLGLERAENFRKLALTASIRRPRGRPKKAIVETESNEIVVDNEAEKLMNAPAVENQYIDNQENAKDESFRPRRRITSTWKSKEMENSLLSDVETEPENMQLIVNRPNPEAEYNETNIKSELESEHQDVGGNGVATTRKSKRTLKKPESFASELLDSDYNDDGEDDPDFELDETTFRKVEMSSETSETLQSESDESDGSTETGDDDDDDDGEDKNDDNIRKPRGNLWKVDKKQERLWCDGVEILNLPDGMQCSSCGEVIPGKGSVWRQRSKMKDHIMGKHRDTYHCFVCNKTYSTKSHLSTHIKRVHEKSTSTLCDICQKPFGTKQSMMRHRWTHKNKEEQEAALAAGEKQRTNGSENLKTAQCKTCGKICTGPYNLKKHEETHTDLSERQKFMCQICGSIYSHADSLKSHIKLSHENDRLQWLQCPHCPKKFPQQARLTKHLCTHTGLKPFTCEQCGKGYVTKTLLKVHKYRHQNIRPHQCSHCDMGFYKNYHLQRHIKAYHVNPNPNKKKLPYRSENGTRKTNKTRTICPDKDDVTVVTPNITSQTDLSTDGSDTNESNSPMEIQSNSINSQQLLGLVIDQTQNFSLNLQLPVSPTPMPYPYNYTMTNNELDQ